MIVVSNTSPLTNLAAIDQFDLLRQLYGQVHLPEGVWAELNAQGQVWPGRDEVAQADTYKLAHITRNPRVALNFDGNSQGRNIVVFTGEAHLAPMRLRLTRWRNTPPTIRPVSNGST